MKYYVLTLAIALAIFGMVLSFYTPIGGVIILAYVGLYSMFELAESADAIKAKIKEMKGITPIPQKAISW